ncbi:MAG: hypothetical protein VST68_07120, partial [Nitrospirota bacterium]|nr:hypothetical protein [Nitrospirota bacterium]
GLVILQVLNENGFRLIDHQSPLTALPIEYSSLYRWSLSDCSFFMVHLPIVMGILCNLMI